MEGLREYKRQQQRRAWLERHCRGPICAGCSVVYGPAHPLRYENPVVHAGNQHAAQVQRAFPEDPRWQALSAGTSQPRELPERIGLLPCSDCDDDQR
jgi:hypothetical protein